MTSIIPVVDVTFASGGSQAESITRLALAATHSKPSYEALETLISLTALAHRLDCVVSMTARIADLEELEQKKLIRRVSSGGIELL